MQPNLVLLGAQKAGTTSLHDWLSQHPDIFSIPEIKDRDFYSHPERRVHPERAMEPYFKSYTGQRYRLHTHVNYLIYRQAIEGLAQIPDLQLMAVLRDPVDRAVSAYNYFQKLRKEKRSIEEALDYEPRAIEDFSFFNNDFTYIEHGLYAEQIERILAVFPRERLLILDYGQLRRDRAGFMRKIFDFLALPDSNSIQYEDRNITGEVRSDSVQELLSAGKGASWMRTLASRILSPENRRKLKEKLIEWNTEKGVSKPVEASPELRRALRKRFERDSRKLAEQHGFEPALKWLEKDQNPAT
ncbi:hypothetical protein GC167_03400 [bacterium]|nr:hypothetical protein [bacterium]